MRHRGLTFAVVLHALLVGHDAGDHLVQTDHQAAHKAKNWSAMAGHVGGYTAACAAALAATAAATGIRPSLLRTITGLTFSAVTHALIDRRKPVVWLLENTGSPKFAHARTRVEFTVNPDGRIPRPDDAPDGEPFRVEADGPVMLAGPYLADQALHRVALALAAAIIAGGRRG